MALFLPDHTFIAALFPHRADLDGLERAALRFGLSIAIVPSLGAGPQLYALGIRLTPVALSPSLHRGYGGNSISAVDECDQEERFSIEFMK